MRRIGLAICIVMAVYIIVWLVRFIGGTFDKAMEQRDVPVDESRARVVETA